MKDFQVNGRFSEIYFHVQAILEICFKLHDCNFIYVYYFGKLG